mmetsp:Transcript_36258/g.89217  ORF Transcript_36258/g.89217 Transcript_36258/m.89217 type:complete len:199 (-) Transcript_36258:1541-2137(-)
MARLTDLDVERVRLLREALEGESELRTGLSHIVAAQQRDKRELLHRLQPLQEEAGAIRDELLALRTRFAASSRDAFRTVAEGLLSLSGRAAQLKDLVVTEVRRELVLLLTRGRQRVRCLELLLRARGPERAKHPRRARRFGPTSPRYQRASTRFADSSKERSSSRSRRRGARRGACRGAWWRRSASGSRRRSPPRPTR